MLSGFEAFLAAVVAERLADRPGLTVGVAGPPPAPPAGAGVLQLGVTVATSETGKAFSPGNVPPPVNDPKAIRAVPLRATVSATVTRRAAAATDAGIRAARALALADVTVLLHSLDDHDVRSGNTLTPLEQDPGFRVLELAFDDLTVAPVVGEVAQMTATYACSLYVWPPGTKSEGGVIDAVDALLEALPLTVAAAPAVVAAGGSAQVAIGGVSGSRMLDAGTGARQPVRIAVGVHSDFPPAERGGIDGGDATTLTGFRAFDVTQPVTAVVYSAPSGQLGAVRSEEVVVHLAVPSGAAADDVGVRLGSIVVRLREGP